MPQPRFHAFGGEQQFVVPFHEEEPGERGEHDAERGGQRELGMQAPTLRRTMVAP